MDFSIYPLQRYNKNRLYVYFADEHGDEIRRSTGITYPLKASKTQRKKARAEAEEAAVEIILEYYTNQKLQQEKEEAAPMFSEYLKNYYLPHIRTNCAESTCERYQDAYRHWLRICGDQPLSEYDRKAINRYKLQRCNKEAIKKTTINIELRSIKAAFSWAYKNDILNQNPYKGQDMLFDAKNKKRAFTVDEVKRLLKQTEGKMIGLVVRLAYLTGMRIGETTKLRWNMVNLEERYIHIPAKITKTGKNRIIPLGEKAFNIVKILEHVLSKKMKKHPEFYENKSKAQCYVLQKQRGHGRYACRSIQQRFRRAMNKAGLPKELTFHCLRHSFATHTLEKGGDMYAVSKIMGHSSVAVTSKFYDHTTALNYRETANLL